MAVETREIASYWRQARGWWQTESPHGPRCPCLGCADLRAQLGWARLPVSIGRRSFETFAPIRED